VHLQSRLGKNDGRRQSIRAGTDDTRLTAHRESP
jgi:hypothetical protein